MESKSISDVVKEKKLGTPQQDTIFKDISKNLIASLSHSTDAKPRTRQDENGKLYIDFGGGAYEGGFSIVINLDRENIIIYPSYSKRHK